MIARLLTALLVLTLGVGTAREAAALAVVATSTSMGALARAVGAERVGVIVLAAPDRDLHALQAKPTMIRALRDADLVIAVGAELEVGWLPLAIASAANPRIQPGQPGYFEAADQVVRLDVGIPADRALGDVHPAGNPHVNLDPVRMSAIAAALAERMAGLDPDGAAGYRANAAGFAAALEQRLPSWQERLASAPGVLLYHRDALYLLDRFGVPLLGTLEEVPGVPPTARHLKRLTEQLRGRAGVVIHTPYQSPRAPRQMAQILGWPVYSLPLDPPADADAQAYLDHLDRWVMSLSPQP
ncbi:MAG: zinc ABC transporter substrate-binding protein [Sphingobacteriia bacterium]|nr:zinc ABC transporter substrate-binding protein [Sphingobacteriia bacterium]NCC38493.1 zinc ABC transporter substrate-binding protein [Gammaproteobacteria bacterium]